MSTDLHQSPEEDDQSRISSACDFCKRQHIRCDGLQSCSNCTKRNLVCTFGLNKKRKSKPTKKKTKTEEVQETSLALPSIKEGDEQYRHMITFFMQVTGRDPYFSWLKEVPPLSLIHSQNVELSQTQLDQKLILQGIILFGACLTRNHSFAESLYLQAKETFTRLIGSTSLDFIKGVFLLGIYCFAVGKADESISYISLNNQILSMKPTSCLTEDVSTIFAYILGITSFASPNREDRHYLFQKARRLNLKPYELYELTSSFVHGEILHQSGGPDENYDLDCVCHMLNENEELLRTAGLQDFQIIFNTLFIWTQRSGAYLKAGKFELALEWATRATDLSFDPRIEYHHPTTMCAVAFLTKIDLQLENVANLENNLRILSLVVEYFPFLKSLMGRVRNVLARYNKVFAESFQDAQEDTSMSSFEKFFEPCSPSLPSSSSSSPFPPENSPELALDPVILAIAGGTSIYF
eukprot:TRINITY_DN6736_c0_g1_i1.p1 TRINITY_DN6736_c0_g1~~TRINITY_DN6736_c0_g1_i1.p1  ORF type:complete len:466 (+),score=102.66 TRINITY_DN6736_c0_g1_i1:84-1481(+)